MIADLVASQRETDRRFQQTERQIGELGRQIGGLGNKFGSFTEGLAYQSCRRILRDDFHMDTVAHELLVRRPEGQNEEYDMLGVANGKRKEVLVVEMKSHLSLRDIEQLQRKCRDLSHYLPAYRGWKVRGLFAAVQVPRKLDREVARAGFYLATGADENFRLLSPPEGFHAATF